MLHTTELRIHDASSVPCGSCGAPLPIDPTAWHVWCASCHRWQEVPHDIRVRAWQQMQAEQAARARAQEHLKSAASERKVAGYRRMGSTMQLVGLMYIVLIAGVPTVIGAVVGLFGWVASLADEYELWAVALIGGFVAISLFVVIIGLVAVSIALWRLATRHKRRRTARHGEARDWLAAGHGAGAVCGVCGAPVTFRPGEHSLQCGFCRSVVVASAEQSDRLISFALAESQLAELELAKAERERLRAEITLAQRSAAYRFYASAGMLACLALPVLAALYAFRTLTPSLEQHLVALADELRGEFGAGMELPFEWLNRYWLGRTPDGLTKHSTYGSRWSIEGVFHDRPFLLSVATGWTDRVATHAVIAVARPRRRNKDLSRTLAAARVRADGWTFAAPYAGVVLEAQNVAMDALTTEKLTRLATAAYELAEER